MESNDDDRPESQRIYRYWVEIRESRDGSARTLPLRVVRLVYLGGKRSDPPKPDEQVLRFQDGATRIEARDIEGLATQLRKIYPDATYQRRLHCERDLEAEQRHQDALHSLIDLLAELAVNDILSEQAAGLNDSGTTYDRTNRAADSAPVTASA
jgi:hypothetical protein